MYNNSDRSQWLGSMENSLRSRKYSVSTRKRYLTICGHIAEAFPDVELPSLGKKDLEHFFAGLERSGACASTINQAISAAAFLWHNVFETPFPIAVRPVDDQRLPTVLSRSDIIYLILCGRPMRAKIALSLAYSAGMRVSEIASLEMKDIDRTRHVIYIRAGKGRKDRIVPLADITGILIDMYLEKHTVGRWLFEGQKAGHIKVRSLQHEIVMARQRARLPENVTMHSLRHSFATHLVERGENLITVKELMGHSSLDTLQKYVHIAAGGVSSTKSPLDVPKGLYER